MDKQLTVLITRPQPGADAFAGMLTDLPVIVSPLMVIEPVAADLAEADLAVITSAHAIPALNGQRCYCVGVATTRAAQAAGCDAIMAGRTAEELAARVIGDKPEGRIVYARGRHVAFDMVGTLNSAGLNATEAIVYEQQPQCLSDEANAVLFAADPVIAPLFSVRSARLFFEACPQNADLRVIAISDAVAEVVPERYRAQLSVVPNPDAASMAQAVRNTT